ncbi:hypothetical protein ACSS6W_005546 [Trichoderma asperelloides]
MRETALQIVLYHWPLKEPIGRPADGSMAYASQTRPSRIWDIIPAQYIRP